MEYPITIVQVRQFGVPGIVLLELCGEQCHVNWELFIAQIVQASCFHWTLMANFVCMITFRCNYHFKHIYNVSVRLTESNRSVYNPMFTPDGKYLLWLETIVGGPHRSAMSLKKLQWKEEQVIIL